MRQNNQGERSGGSAEGELPTAGGRLSQVQYIQHEEQGSIAYTMGLDTGAQVGVPRQGGSRDSGRATNGESRASGYVRTSASFPDLPF